MTPDTSPLREALEPFAAYARNARSMPDNFVISAGSKMARRQLTIGDCRAAEAALASEPVAGTVASDFEQVFKDACDEAGCTHDNEALLKAIADLKIPPTPAGREEIARVIDPTCFSLPRIHLYQKRYQQAYAKADAILALGATVTPQGGGATSSPAPLSAPHNSGERDPSVMPDYGAGEPVAWRWRTLPRYREDGDIGEWSWIETAPDFMNPHHHEVEPLYAIPPVPGPADRAEWQPIETAPKDGTHIFAYRMPVGIRVTNLTNPPTVVHWFDDSEQPGFYTSVNERAPEYPFNPTHWKPLDAPPGPTHSRAQRGAGS